MRKLWVILKPKSSVLYLGGLRFLSFLWWESVRLSRYLFKNMEIKKNYNLVKLNTFRIAVQAKFFVEVVNENDLLELFQDPIFKENKKLFLGGGSNILFTKDFDGIVVLNRLKGIEIIEQDYETVTIRALGGETWHDLVTFAVNHGYWGIENLSLI